MPYTCSYNVVKNAPDGPLWTEPHHGGSKAYLFVREAIERNIHRYSSSIAAVKLLLPTVDDYAVRNDIVQRRFLTCELAEMVVDFTTLRQKIGAFEFGGEDILSNALNNAVDAVLLKSPPGTNRPLVAAAMALLEAEIAARLSFSWITDRPLPTKRLALVDGKPHAAVSAVSMDHDGHWLQDPATEHMRDEFIVCDMALAEGLPDRIIEALSKSKGPIDAITTYSDLYLLATARAAKRMGLHTNPPEALEVCRDKRKTREIASADVHILPITGVVDLKEQLTRLTSPLRYPLIVKPTTGSSSEGVSKATSEVELLDAVQRIEEMFPRVESLIEPYISGPEVDANFILLDGKLIWCEINDDFPSSAEIPKTSKVSGESPLSSSPSLSFAETSTIMPSILPQSELLLMKLSLTQTLLKLGFGNGVFHLEARIKDSRKNFAMTDKGIELVDSRAGVGNNLQPSIFLIEINARIPGYQESFAVEYTYGIDYFAVHMLAALLPCASATETADDSALKSIIRALSQPLPLHFQYPTHIVFIPAERGGTFVAAEPLPESLMSYVPHYMVLMQNGQVIKDPEIEGKWPFVAYFLVTAKLNGAEGREQVRTIGEVVRESFEYEMRGCPEDRLYSTSSKI